MMTDEQLNILGIEIVDKANNILALQRLPLPPQDIVKAFAGVLRDIRDTGRKLHNEFSTYDPWEDWGDNWRE